MSGMYAALTLPPPVTLSLRGARPRRKASRSPACRQRERHHLSADSIIASSFSRIATHLSLSTAIL